jgi:integrase
VKGAKHDSVRGTESRTISISNSELSKSSEGRHIMEKFAEGKTGTIKADGDIISGRIAQAGERAGMEERASAYDYRHAFSARNKDNPELSPQDRADALGHRNTDSQGSYGRSGQSGGSGNIS